MTVIDLGKYAKDKITQFEGVITQISYSLTGTTRCELTPEGKKDEVRKTEWFDCGRISFVEKIPMEFKGFTN